LSILDLSQLSRDITEIMDKVIKEFVITSKP